MVSGSPKAKHIAAPEPNPTRAHGEAYRNLFFSDIRKVMFQATTARLTDGSDADKTGIFFTNAGRFTL